MIVIHPNRSRFGVFYTARAGRRLVFAASAIDAAAVAVLAFVGSVQEWGRA